MIKLITSHSDTPIDQHAEVRALLEAGWRVHTFTTKPANLGYYWLALLEYAPPLEACTAEPVKPVKKGLRK